MKNLLLKKILCFLAIFIPVLISFRWLFISHSLSWGDAPYFYKEGLNELLAEPLAWVSRNVSLGGTNLILWLSPNMILYGLLGKLFSNDNILRILFYIPSVVLAGVSPLLLTKYLKLSKTVQFFTSLVYVLNTYFILLIDGGQVGVSLAYSLLPLALLFYRKLVDEVSNKNFFLSLVFGFLLFAIDPRLGIISVVAFILWALLEKKNPKYFLLSLVGVGALSFYWLKPLTSLDTGLLTASNSESNLVTLINSLLLFSPHWPANEFGRVFSPPFYFVFIPALIFLGLFLKPKKENFILGISFLIFAFLAKGSAAPFGELYGYFVEKIPFGSALRDSSKFFAPTVLFAGILIGKAVEAVDKAWFKVLVYGFLIFLIYPVYTRGLNFVLSGRDHGTHVKTISEKISQAEGFTRTAWFPEKNPTAFHTDEKQTLDAKDLVNLRPLAALSVGDYDLFNYIHNPEFISWYKFFGIDYLVLGENPRIKDLSEEEKLNSQDLRDRVATVSGLLKKDWTENNPVYEISGAYPRIFTAEKVLGVIGSDVSVTPEMGVPVIYFEDGKFDPANLQGLSPDSLTLVFNKKGMDDLRLSFLQKYFVSAKDSLKSQWAMFGPNKYLKYKFELLIRDFKFNDFDYGRGIAFSTQKGEKIEFKFKVPEDGKYIVAVRSANFENQNFSWKIQEFNLKKGTFKYSIVNESGFEVLNTMALIPSIAWETAKTLSENFVSHFGSITVEDVVKLKASSWGSLEIKKKSPVSYKIEAPQKGYWVIFTDSYHSEWKLRKGIQYYQPLPIYSAVNGFYVDPKWTDLEILFWGQRYLRWGIYYSLIAGISLTIIFLWNYKKD